MMTPDTFRRWRKRHGIAQEMGGREIPRYVSLATVGSDSLDEPTNS
jgi:hypothetical protein